MKCSKYLLDQQDLRDREGLRDLGPHPRQPGLQDRVRRLLRRDQRDQEHLEIVEFIITLMNKK